jgi:hypothetical protein
MLNEKERDYLNKLMVQLKKAKKTALFSFNICAKIGIKDAYSEDEEDRFESLTSKFSRLSDLIIKKAIRTIEIFDLESPPDSIRDLISISEKKGLISSEFKFIEIRRTRNIIAHEYIIDDDDVVFIYKYVLENIIFLLDAVDKIIEYCKKYDT